MEKGTKQFIHKKKDLDMELRFLHHFTDNLYHNIMNMEKSAKTRRLEARVLHLMQYFEELKLLRTGAGDASLFNKIEQIEKTLGKIYISLHKLNYRDAKPVKTAAYIKEGIASISNQSVLKSLRKEDE